MLRDEDIQGLKNRPRRGTTDLDLWYPEPTNWQNTLWWWWRWYYTNTDINILKMWNHYKTQIINMNPLHILLTQVLFLFSLQTNISCTLFMETLYLYCQGYLQSFLYLAITLISLIQAAYSSLVLYSFWRCYKLNFHKISMCLLNLDFCSKCHTSHISKTLYHFSGVSLMHHFWYHYVHKPYFSLWHTW